MSRYVYLNGTYIPANAAAMPLDDRGLLFGDAVYEVIHFRQNFYVDGEGHLARLDRSLAELSIERPYVSHQSLMIKLRYLQGLNAIKEGFVYIQISRGIAPRAHPFPEYALPSFFMTMSAKNYMAFSPQEICTAKDGRWHRCDIKTTNLLHNVLAKQDAAEKGLFDTWGVTDDGFITEGALSNAWMIKDGIVYTAPETCNILGGITRRRILQIAQGLQIKVQEKAFTLDALYAADEAFSSSTNAVVIPITKVDSKLIGTGRPGVLTEKLNNAYMKFVELGVSCG